MPAFAPGSTGFSTPLAAAAAARRIRWPALCGATLAALLFTAIAVPRVDYEQAAADALERSGAAAELTPHEREAALAAARRLGGLGAYLDALAGTALRAAGAALALWLAFQVVGGRPDLASSHAVACLGLLPFALRHLLSIPALLSRPRLAPGELDRLLPSSLGALLEPGAQGPVPSLLWSADLFAFLAVALVAAAMADVAGVSLRRSLATTAALWLGQVAVFQVALPALGGLR